MLTIGTNAVTVNDKTFGFFPNFRFHRKDGLSPAYVKVTKSAILMYFLLLDLCLWIAVL